MAVASKFFSVNPLKVQKIIILSINNFSGFNCGGQKTVEEVTAEFLTTLNEIICFFGA